MTEDFGVKVDDIISELVEHVKVLKAENDEKNAKLKQLTDTICVLEDTVSKVSTAKPLTKYS